MCSMDDARVQAAEPVEDEKCAPSEGDGRSTTMSSQSSIAASVGSTASNIGATMLLTLGWERDTLQFTLAMRLLAPISGIVFLLFAPSLWPRVVIAVILVAVIELVTTSLMLAFLMPLQAEVISLLIGDAAGWTFATSLTLVEAGALVWFLCNVVTDHARRRIYDEVCA